MCADAQPDGRPAEHRWRLLFNAAKFGWRPLLECRAVTLPRRETRWNLQGCPTLPDRSQPLVGLSSPYCGGHVEEILLVNNFSPIVYMCLSCEDIAWESCVMVPRWRFFGEFLRPVFLVSRVQHVSDLHLKFTLRPPHHAWNYGRYPTCDGWD